MNSVRLTILVDNVAQNGCLGEHGFALWLDVGDHRILLDTGQGSALAANMQALGLEPGQLDDLVLSHGHYDHTGSAPWLLSHASGCRVWCHPGAVDPRYSIRDGEVRDISMPAVSRRALGSLSASRLRWSAKPVILAPGVGLTGAIPRRTDFEDPGGPFFLDPHGRRPDPVEDDQALWIDTDRGVVVCVGCCHAGLINTLSYVGELSGGRSILAVVGGLHLGAAGPDRLERTVSLLRDFNPEMLLACHCTGEEAVSRLRSGLDCQVLTGYAGMRLDMSRS